MKHWANVLAVLAVLATGLFLRPTETSALPDAAVKKIAEAAPAQARVKPAKPRTILVFGLARGFGHASIPFGAEAFVQMGKKTGAFEAVVSEDPAMFDPANLARFDAVILNNTTGEFLLPKKDLYEKMTPAEKEAAKKKEGVRKAALLAFVKSGKGLVGVHSATDAYYTWPEYGKLIGGYFAGHPWFLGKHPDGSDSAPVVIRVEEPTHPLTGSLDGNPIKIREEIYQFRLPYSRRNLRVLLSLDITQTDMVGKRRPNEKRGNIARQIRRADRDFPVSWIRTYGKGRVFYCSLGHSNEVFVRPRIMQHYLAGIQYALGDLPADATPSGLPQPGQAVMPSLNDAFKQLPGYSQKVSDSRAALSVIEVQVRKSATDPPARQALAKRLAAVLNKQSTLDAQRFACRQLRLVGSPDQLPALLPLLSDPALTHMARYALEGIAGPAVDKALRDALENLKGKPLLGLIHTLGRRGDAEAVDPLVDLLEAKPPETVLAAAEALVTLGGEKALEAVADLWEDTDKKSKLYPALTDCYLRSADRWAEEAPDWVDLERATEIYEALQDKTLPDPIRLAALRGLAATDPKEALPLAIKALKGKNHFLQAGAVGLVADFSGKAATRAFAKELPGLPAPARRNLIDALAAHGDKAAGTAVTVELASKDPAVRLAALRALATLGDANSVMLLASVATRTKGAERSAARASLARLQGTAVEKEMVAQLAKATPAIRAELARTLGARRAHSAVGPLLKAARDKEVGVRRQAYIALGAMAGKSEWPQLIALLRAEPAEGERLEAEKMLVRCGARLIDLDEATRLILAPPAKKSPIGARVALLRVLASLGTPEGLTAVRTALNSKAQGVRDGAVEALSHWPDAAALKDLDRLVRTSKSKVHRILAFRGMLRLLTLPDLRPEADTLALLKEAIAIAPRIEEKKRVIGALGARHSLAALALAEASLKDDALREEAASAIVKIARSIRGIYGVGVTAALEKAKAQSTNATTRKAATTLLGQIATHAGAITAWDVSPIYTGNEPAGQPGGSLLQKLYPPEQAKLKAAVPWEPLQLRSGRPWVIDLSNLYNLRPDAYRPSAIYLRTKVWSPHRQKASLELGSNQGMMAWLNGRLVHAFDGERRPWAIGQDRTAVTLKKGWNELRLKLTRNGGPWAVSARLRAPDGSVLQRLVARPERAEAEKMALFDGRNGWIIMGRRSGWSVKDGLIRSESGKGGHWLRSTRRYDNFVLSLEWRISEGGNSGVFIRGGLNGDPAYSGHEVQISNQHRDDKHCTGSLYGSVAVNPRPSETHDVWHRYQIRCIGKRITVIADGVTCVDADMDKIPAIRNKPMNGFVGMQDSHNPKGWVEYRNIRIREIGKK